MTGYKKTVSTHFECNCSVFKEKQDVINFIDLVLRGKIKMTPSEQAKAQGFKSLAQVAELSGVNVRTLNNWQ